MIVTSTIQINYDSPQWQYDADELVTQNGVFSQQDPEYT